MKFIKMAKNEVCPEKPMTMQKPRKSGGKVERKRFKPRIPPPIIGSSAKLISGHPQTGTKSAIDVCFRLNGALMSLPQNVEEEKIMDKILWDYMMKKAANNITQLIEDKNTIWISIAGETEFIPEESVDLCQPTLVEFTGIHQEFLKSSLL